MAFVYIRNMGGIGNQLFIYNFGKLISSKTKYKLLIDNTTGFVRDSYGRKPKLDLLFKSNPNEANLLLKILFLVIKKMPKIFLNHMKVDFLFEISSKQVIDIKNVLNYKNKFIFIQGYFQSYDYVLPNINEIPKLLKLEYNFNTTYIDYYNQIKTNNSVCLHVRRDSYDNYLAYSYYINAIQLICTTEVNPIFYVFSDSLDWCKENIKSEKIIYIDAKENTDDIQEFFLMKNCKHFIIANSTFSWWTAMFGMSDNKLVIAPSQNQLGVIETFYPSEWIKI